MELIDFKISLLVVRVWVENHRLYFSISPFGGINVGEGEAVGEEFRFGQCSFSITKCSLGQEKNTVSV